ncbi:universal stress protein [Roseicitreum antarcticum]|uniref:Nucleotide-binding universal stress protein, UspA family n=1 Tax=Roseicitreum antarcticum TaxID=564137 RepID=A0A1H3CE41_9RHOB|nr:universal stress protein [Roseicitreum antarcticum]SDX52417.1 Nucleotide-binding universal stress protein, UspA family [Roseicitreum antarcticum]
MYDAIVVAVALFNKGATSRGLIEKAAKMLNPGGQITLVHVMDELPAYIAASVSKEQLSGHRRSAMTQLESLATVARGKDVRIDMRSGMPSVGILESAKESKADIIMIASHSPGLKDYFIGSTATRVVRHAHCSVHIARKRD